MKAPTQSSRGLFCDCGTSIFTKVCFQLLSSLPGHSQRWRGGRPSGNWYPETAFKDSHLICFIAVSLPAPLCINGLTWMPCILHIQIQTYSFRVRLDSTSVYLYYMKYYAFIKADNKPFVIPFRSNYCIGIDCVYFVHERVIIRDALSPLTAQTQVNIDCRLHPHSTHTLLQTLALLQHHPFILYYYYERERA